MNNEERILKMLEQMQSDISGMKGDISGLKDNQEKTDTAIHQMRKEMNERFDALESSLKYAWEDIDRVEKRIKQHEKEFHLVG